MLERVPAGPVLGLDTADVAKLPAEAIPGLLAAASALVGAVAARLAAAPVQAPSGAGPSPGPSTNGGDLLTCDEVGALLKKPRHAVYSLLRRKDLAPAVVRINRRTLRVRRGELLRRLGIE